MASDIQRDLADHVEASRERDRLAQEGLALVEAGKRREAKRLLKQAEEWDVKARVIEGRHPRYR